MCNPIQVFTFACGHVLQQLPLMRVTPCLLPHRRMCYEIGIVRYIEYVKVTPCPACGNWKPGRRSRHTHHNLNTPFGQGRQNVGGVQQRARPGMPVSAARGAEISRLARQQLRLQLEDPAMHTRDTIEWLVRLIAGLPEFVARQDLARILEPYLGAVFDERAQEDLRPIFGKISVPDIYDRTMLWTPTPRHRGRAFVNGVKQFR